MTFMTHNTRVTLAQYTYSKTNLSENNNRTDQILIIKLWLELQFLMIELQIQ